MISIKVKKVNSKIEKIVQKYQKIDNYGELECPCCRSHELIRWGKYTRYVIYKDKNEEITPLELEVNRVRCKECGHTHALLPIGLIPYKQITVELMIEILEKLETISVDKVSEKYNFGIETIKRWKRQFNKVHKPRLKTSFKLAIKEILRILNEVEKQVEYFIKNKILFMQIKPLKISIGYNNL